MFQRVLRLFPLLASVVFAAQPAPAVRDATPDEVVLLVQSLEKTAADMRRWAYTESRVMRDEKGKVKNSTVLRYDPSKPYAEQWTPISINGKEPSAKDLESYRKRGERAGRRAERGEKGDQRRSLGEVIDPTKARIASENARELVYELPLRKDANDRFPPEKFLVHARIARESRALENIAVTLRESFRAKLILKVKSGDGSIDFTVVDPKHPPTLTAVTGDASASVLFVSVGGEFEMKRTDLKRVKPYDERFEVQIGTLKAIDL